MRTTYMAKMHQKCLNILEMIDTAEKIIERAKFDHQRSMGTVEEWFERRIDKYTRIKSRLVDYYANTFIKMCKFIETKTETA